MTLNEAKEIIVPFGRNNGWPLGSLVDRRFSEFDRLARQRETLFGDVKEAMEALTADPDIADKLRRYRRQMKTYRTNRAHLNNWVWR